MSRARRALGLLGALALGLPLPWAGAAAAPARVAVEVLGGFDEPAPVSEDAGPPPTLLLDATGSMARSTGAGVARIEAARRAAARLVRELARERPLALHVLAPDPARSCEPARHATRRVPGESREAVLAQVRGLVPGGETSLAEAAAALRAARGDALERGRLVVFSDLGDECGGDLCAELSQWVAGGTRVDLVVAGDAPVPDCIARFEAIGSWRSEAEAREPPRFRIEVRGEGGTRRVVARGRANGAAVEAPAGRATLVVELEPELRVGPVQLTPDASGRLRILDFPGLTPPVREWRFERQREGEQERGAAEPAPAAPFDSDTRSR